MSEELAAQAEGEVIDDPRLDTPEVETETEAKPSESATDDKPKEAPQDGFQKRINKVTADKHEERRQKEALQKRVDELEAAQPLSVVGTAPKLEDFDFDQDKFNEALIDHKVNNAIAANQVKQDTDNRNAQANQASKDFNSLVSELGKEDFYEVAGKIPALDQALVSELMSTKEGVEMIYHLGGHLDLADKIAGMSPLQAMGELGRISVNMAAKPEVKLSAAPDPIEPLNSGGSVSQERGPKGATFE